jgi:hypothetical protein
MYSLARHEAQRCFRAHAGIGIFREPAYKRKRKIFTEAGPSEKKRTSGASAFFQAC